MARRLQAGTRTLFREVWDALGDVLSPVPRKRRNVRRTLDERLQDDMDSIERSLGEAIEQIGEASKTVRARQQSCDRPEADGLVT